MADFRYGFFSRPDNKKIELHPEEKSKTSHASDHKCKPVLVDAEGRRQPIIVLPGEMYVTKTEIFTEEVYSSSENESQHSHTTKYEPVKYYGRQHDKGNRHSSPACDRLTEVDKFITKIQMEASQPMKYPMSSTYRRQSPHTRVLDDINNSFSCYDDHNKKVANKPNRYAKQHSIHHNGYNSDNDEHDYSDNEPHMMMTNHTFELAPLAYVPIHKSTNGIGPEESKVKTSGGWLRLSDVARDVPPTCDARVSAPMNDIEKIVEYLKEVVHLQSGVNASNLKNTCPTRLVSDPLRKESYTKPIDSNEGARRYGNFRPPHPMQGANVATIDCKEAARKYNGTKV